MPYSLWCPQTLSSIRESGSLFRSKLNHVPAALSRSLYFQHMRGITQGGHGLKYQGTTCKMMAGSWQQSQEFNMFLIFCKIFAFLHCVILKNIIYSKIPTVYLCIFEFFRNSDIISIRHKELIHVNH